METKDLEVKLSSIETELKKFVEKHADELKANGTATTETKTALAKLGEEWKEASARLLAVEQKMATRNENGGEKVKSIGELLIESDGFKRAPESTGKIMIPDIKTAIVNATGQNQPLVPDQRVGGIIGPGLRRFTVRDLMPNLNTSSNLVQFVRELVFTNAAAMQTGGSPNSGENVSKAESALTFELANAAVQTLAHWIPASRQILDDAPALMGYINSRLMYGLKLAEETELLFGDGTGNHLSGLVANSTAFDTAVSSTSDTFIDVLRKAITQVQLSYFEPSGIVLNPKDWETIQLTKTTGTASSGEYIFSNPHVVETDRIWGLPVVVTQAMPVSQFMVGAFNMASALWDRTGATIEVSREHASYFIQNMVAILCEERLTITVFRPLAIVYGGFPYGS